MDKSKENTRIAELLAMTEEQVKTKIAVGIDNPALYKQFVDENELKWEYAVAAKLLSEDDVRWIKENINSQGQEAPNDGDEPDPFAGQLEQEN